MRNKKVFYILGVLLIILVAAMFILRGPSKVGITTNLRVGTHEYSVEIADTVIKQAQGLSGRSSLAENSGMLFVFKNPSMQSFWMVGMQFPLDFVWINEGKVIGVTENVPFTPQTARQSPPSPANMVLELSAGSVERDGIKVGDVVELKQ
mgnify:CR=1 FL=1